MGMLFTIRENKSLTRDVFRMTLCGDTSGITRPGQFVNVQLAGKYLRRPISVCDWSDGTLTLIYKVVGGGTRQMSGMKPGETLDLLCPLGNGFDPDACAGKRVALVGGGVGVPPLYGLAKRLRARGERVSVVLGFRTAAEVFLEAEFASLGCAVTVVTDDGSYGVHGNVCTALQSMEYDHYCACGPQPMLRAVHALGKEGQLSFEERMGCGFGACMGCSCHTLVGDKRVCVDGPVFPSGEVSFGA
ncbi:MAG: dihydroorotate dehydrogenase electron transfer subunit [Clostridia bacterium]|nr:dihydroorotate dehydrogenase electron transfer subunit [Clostridia bacterium]